jgi:hypothetical protein
MPVPDRQIFAAAYLPVIAFGTVLIAAPTSGTRRHQLRAALR